jgi:excinuclease ABC subunit B
MQDFRACYTIDSHGKQFQAPFAVPASGRSAEGDREDLRRPREGPQAPDAARRDGQRQDAHDRQRDREQPEAYIAHSDTYIEKEAMVNAEIDRLRHAATQALLTRKDVIIVASVSAIYGLGSPENYEKVHVKLAVGEKENRADLIRKLVRIYFERTNADLEPGQLRAVGNAVEFMPTNERSIYRISFDGDTVAHIDALDPVSRAKTGEPDTIFVFPAKHFVTDEDNRNRALEDIKR